jgi:hypothetical protein
VPAYNRLILRGQCLDFGSCRTICGASLLHRVEQGTRWAVAGPNRGPFQCAEVGDEGRTRGSRSEIQMESHVASLDCCTKGRSVNRAKRTARLGPYASHRTNSGCRSIPLGITPQQTSSACCPTHRSKDCPSRRTRTACRIAQDHAALCNQLEHALHDGLRLRGRLVAPRRHDATPRIGTSHHIPAVSGTVMNSCPWPHQYTSTAAGRSAGDRGRSTW